VPRERNSARKIHADEVKLPAPDGTRARIQRAAYVPQRARS
jgi:hypothetical protein